MPKRSKVSVRTNECAAAKEYAELERQVRLENERLIAEGRGDEIYRRLCQDLGIREGARGRLVSIGGFRIDK